MQRNSISCKTPPIWWRYNDIRLLLKELLCEEEYLLASGIGKGTKYVLKDTGKALVSPIVEGEIVLKMKRNRGKFKIYICPFVMFVPMNSCL